MIKRLLVAFILLAAFVQLATAQNSTSVGFDSGAATPVVFDNNNIALTAGGPGDGNGAVIQLGYFTGGTLANPFAGTFVALSGQGSANTGVVPGSTETYNQTSIGDETSLIGNPNANGAFAINLVFTQGDPLTGNNLPSSTTIPLAIRFYNGTSLASSTFYNTVSANNSAWLWQSPSTPPAPVQISLADTGLVWEDSVHPFMTTIPFTAVPEPSSYAFLGLGAAGLMFVRRRASKA